MTPHVSLLYTADRKGRLYRGEVHHPRWPLHRAEIGIVENSMLDGWRTGPMHPSVLFWRHLPVVVWPLDRLSGTGIALKIATT